MKSIQLPTKIPSSKTLQPFVHSSQTTHSHTCHCHCSYLLGTISHPVFTTCQLFPSDLFCSCIPLPAFLLLLNDFSTGGAAFEKPNARSAEAAPATAPKQAPELSAPYMCRMQPRRGRTL